MGQTPVAIAAGDLNTDGIPDLAVVNQGDNTVSILLGSTNADATFSGAPVRRCQRATTPAGIVIANFTGGNVPSIAVTNQGQSTLGIYIGLGEGTFSNRLEIATPATPSAIVSAALTSSGLPDVAFTALGTTTNQGVVTMIQDSSSFATGTTPTQTPYPGLGIHRSRREGEGHAHHSTRITKSRFNWNLRFGRSRASTSTAFPSFPIAR